MSATLASLRIRNLALVEELSWEPSAGFTAITGETGAGKSVLIGALTLLLGERADKELIRSGTDSCTVEAVFENISDGRIDGLLEEFGAEPCEEGRLILKRTLSTQGAGRQFANGSPCTLALLRSLGVLLVDLHGPHDHQSLFSRDQQTRLLDRFADAETLCTEFTAARRELLRLREEKASILAGEQAAAREMDLLAHQVREIETATLTPGEEETLAARQRSAANAQRIGEICAQLASGVSEADDSLTSRLGELSRLARELARLDPSSESILQASEAAFSAAEDFSRSISTYSARIEESAGNLDEIEARLDLILSLKRKYGHSIEDILAYHAESAARLASLQAREERRDTLDADISAAASTLEGIGHKLTTKRTTAARKLAEKVRSGLKDLGFAKADFSISLDPLEEPSAHGCETADFQFAPNPGEPPKPLRAIASSGEISRVMLALKGALADQDDVPVMIFDEIDANVGGEIAAKVGRKMQDLGKSRQVLCITHLPQVAACASGHFIVSKDIREGRTRTLLSPATGTSREREIARMLGGQSDSALAHARALLAK